ncbi:hypothetical protein [Corynebacterium sp. TAE3-ERU12]|uniref:hypothetical protein n=1 Tax=Corynebacterium sp. TAE3-ERU12 TaxID=2849491 RepID=UPI0021048788|nr:hypothetical protein [Corynebacterium sp. TAE3-ERU12]
MLGGGFACIDLDKCITAGRIQPWAQRIIDAAPGAFVERSMSGNGLHIFGLLPESPGRVLGRAEVYSRDRFIRVTTDVVQPGGLVALTGAVGLIEQMSNRNEIPQRK